MKELQEAINILEAYRKHLNRSTTKCTHCGMVHRVNWKEYQQAEQIEGIIHKLSRWLAEDNSK